jgi:hypothetical protein
MMTSPRFTVMRAPAVEFASATRLTAEPICGTEPAKP